MSNFADYNEKVKSESRFKLSVLFGHIIENPNITTPELAKKMYTSNQGIDHWLQEILDFVKFTKVKYNNRTIRGLVAINTDKFYWSKTYKESNDPRRDYFDDKFKDLPVELRDAIFAGKISSDIVRVYKEGDLEHTYKPQRMKREFGGIPSMMGEL